MAGVLRKNDNYSTDSGQIAGNRVVVSLLASGNKWELERPSTRGLHVDQLYKDIKSIENVLSEIRP